MALLSPSRAMLLVLVIFVANSMGAWNDCGTTDPRLVRFDSFSAYPLPAVPGQYLHLAATYDILRDISSANISWVVTFQNDTSNTLLDVSGIPLCNFTSAIDCTQLSVSNTSIPISFDWLVPEFAYGDYYVTYYISVPGNFVAYGCISFDITINNASAPQRNQFESYYNAYLIGAANYTADGLVVQVGPVGVLDNAQNLPWGKFSRVYGSADVVHPSFDPTNYIWGLTGNQTSYAVNPVTGQITAVYVGDFFVGYQGPYGEYDTYGNFLTQGNFVFDRYTNIDGTVTINGNIRFEPSGGSFPPGWFNPINLARLGISNLTTDQHGQLLVYQNSSTCLSGSCTPAFIVAPGASSSVGRDHLGAILGAVLGGVLFLLLVGILLFFIIRKRHRRAAEDRVYNGRPNEYADALVVDDIMQKSRAHRGVPLPVVNARGYPDYPPGYLDQYDMPNPRSSRYGGPSNRTSLASNARRPYLTDTDSEPERDDRESSRSRSPRRRSTRAESRRSLSSRSSSPESRRYSGSASGSSRSRSRSRSGSPRSRTPSSDDEGPRR